MTAETTTLFIQPHEVISSTTTTVGGGATATSTLGSVEYDAVVVGAGFSGLRMLHELKRIGLTVRVFEAGPEVGGTWFWNTYPGCRTDCDAWVYSMNFSKELCQEWTWSERYPKQGEVNRYLNYVADKFDMRKDIEFNSKVVSAHFQESESKWTVTTEPGKVVSSKYIVLGTGLLNAQKSVPFANYDTFAGEWFQTASWPKNPVSFKGKRVGVVGTGSTGVQIVPIAAHTAKSVYVFQRTPNYILPVRHHALSDEETTAIKDTYDDIWARAKTQMMGLDMAPAGRVVADVKDNPLAMKRVLDANWEKGGFNFLFQNFDDLFVNKEANEVMCEYLREKTRAIVEDQETAKLLNPDFPIFTKRPSLGHEYLESFNRSNVKLVDIKRSPIKGISPTGISTQSAHYELDMIIYAIGFDAVSGSIAGIDIRGIGGRTIQEEWQHEITAYQGLTLSGFPNMFMTSGPKSTFSNFPVLSAATGAEIGKMISFMREHNYKTIQPKRAKQNAWNDLCNEIFQHTVLAKDAVRTNSWSVGADITEKPTGPLYFFGGLPNFIKECEKESSAGFLGYEFS